MATPGLVRAATIRDRLRAALSSRPEVRLALLFGSHARGQERTDSDVDVAVIAPGSDLLSLGALLSAACGREVDVVPLDDPSIPLLEELVRDAEVIHEAQPGLAASWRSRTLAALEIDRPWFARMRDAWLARVARDGI